MPLAGSSCPLMRLTSDSALAGWLKAPSCR
ncbi:Uncharacterised protein [Bordetella pertussis]|nr:Uncharacterised protein [Bordetella pertussis]